MIKASMITQADSLEAKLDKNAPRLEHRQDTSTQVAQCNMQ